MRELSERGSKYYAEHLQAILEPEQNGKGLAFNPGTGFYFMADTLPRASRAMRAHHPGEGHIVRTIGPEPNYALARRLLAGMQQREYEDRKTREAMQVRTGSVFIGKDEIRSIINERNEKTSFVPDPTAPPQRARERMRAYGVRAEDNIGSAGIIAARDERPLLRKKGDRDNVAFN